MRAMLLCAGFGNRLLPLTRRIPKPMVPVLGRPIAALLLERLARHGVRRAVVNLHHLPDLVSEGLGDGRRLGLERLDYTHEEQRLLGTGGGVRNAAEHLRGDGPVLVVNSDSLSAVDVGAVVETHRRSGCAATLVLAPERPGYSTVLADGDGRIRSIAGVPEVDPASFDRRYMFTGVQVLDPALLDRLPPEGPSDIIRDLHRPLAAEGRLGAHVQTGFWWEFGNPGAYLEGSLALLDLPGSLRADILGGDEVRELPGLRLAAGAGADFHNAVDLQGRVALGAGVRVAEGTTVEDSVVMPGALVGPGCTIRRSVIAPDLELPPGLELEGVLACEDDTGEDEPLPPDTVREHGLLLRALAP